jgi:multiple sugar transport system ATP-binding protein
MASVAFRQVTKRFGAVTALDALDLAADDREFLVLLGPSGCGKSTALRLLAGLDVPTSGAVLIGGDDVSDVDPRERDVAMVFQSYALYPHLTARQNIEFPLRSRKVDAAERRNRVDAVAAQLELEPVLDRKPRQLSGGQRQRVALARAIVRRPAVFLMDEPLSNLDARLRASTRAELVELHRSLGTTFVYVTHDQVEAMTMATRVAVLDGGRLQQVGAPQEVYDRPANTFVARFVGSPPMNLLPPSTGLAPADDGHLLGVRPEHLVLAPDGLGVEVRVVESLGHERHVECVDDQGNEVVVRVAGTQPVPSPGARAHVQAAPGHVHRFDPATGERVAS